VFFLDADNAAAPGCVLLPGDDAPERVVFKGLKAGKWGNLWASGFQKHLDGRGCL